MAAIPIVIVLGCLALAGLVGVLIMLQAYVYPFTLLVH